VTAKPRASHRFAKFEEDFNGRAELPSKTAVTPGRPTHQGRALPSRRPSPSKSQAQQGIGLRARQHAKAKRGASACRGMRLQERSLSTCSGRSQACRRAAGSNRRPKGSLAADSIFTSDGDPRFVGSLTTRGYRPFANQPVGAVSVSRLCCSARDKLGAWGVGRAGVRVALR
jgi:hypothetical protein